MLRVCDAPLPLLSIGHVGDGHVTASLTKFFDFLEGELGSEVLALAGLRNNAVQLVDLLEGKTLGLVDHEVNKGNADEAERSPDEEHFRLQVGVISIDHVGGGVGNGPVEEPVAGGGHGQALGSDLQGEEFSRHDPGNGSPRAGEEEDVDAHKCDGCALGGEIGGSGDGTSDGNDELADTHANGTHEEQITATELLDQPETGEGGGDIDRVGNDLDNEWVLEAGIGEVLSAVVEDEVNTSQLLESLEETSGCETLADSALEAVQV